MPFSFANVDGRACLVEGDSYFDLERISQGSISADPMHAIARNAEFHEIAASLGSEERDGVVVETRLRATFIAQAKEVLQRIGDPPPSKQIDRDIQFVLSRHI